MGNIYHIAINTEGAQKIRFERYVLIEEHGLDVHGAENVSKVLELLKTLPVAKVRDLICPSCLNLTGPHCTCMEDIKKGE